MNTHNERILKQAEYVAKLEECMACMIILQNNLEKENKVKSEWLLEPDHDMVQWAKVKLLGKNGSLLQAWKTIRGQCSDFENVLIQTKYCELFS